MGSTYANAKLVPGLLAAGLAGFLACHAPVRLSVASDEQTESAEPLEQRLWRAGRPISPGLAAARVIELEGERARAVTRLGASLSRSDEIRLERWMADESTPDELWCAAVESLAALGRYDASEGIGRGLGSGASPRRASAARSALHRLYGRWFRDVSELAPYLDAVQGGEGTRLLLASAREEEKRSRERLMAQLAHDPLGATGWLEDPDPEVRSGAARVLAQVFQKESADAGRVLDVLIAHLEGEFQPQAFHECLQACLQRLERADVDAPASARLRALLVEIARQEGDPRTLSSAQALARLPWRTRDARDQGHVLSGIDVLGAMLRGLAAADRRRGLNDPDPFVAVLAAMRELCAQASAAGLVRELRLSAARDSLFSVLADSNQDGAVRAAAAAALGPMARGSDGAALATVLADPAVGAAVKHALLGSLRPILPELAPGAPGAHELLAAVATLTGDPDSDLRRRALALLGEPKLDALVRGLDPAFLVQRLGREDGRDATLEILRLLQRFARPDMLAELLALERFDRLCADAGTLEALAGVLERISASSGRATLEAAIRLARARSEDTSLMRLRLALVLVARLDVTAALALTPAEHEAITSWVWRVVRGGVAPRELVPDALRFEQVVLDVHLPRAQPSGGETGAGLDAFERAHLGALLLADLFLAGTTREGEARTKPVVEAAFESAQSLASTPELRFLVLRDRARFRSAANECVKALSDYRRLLEGGPEGEAWLGIPDLRSAVELLGRLDEAGGKGRSATAGEAADLLLRLVGRGAWRAEPASVRMQDLRDWVRSALDSRDPARLRRLETALADLPLTQPETQPERDPAPLWFGLTREADWFQELLDLRSRVRLGLRELEAQG